MSLPRILVVDDQFASSKTERNLFLRRCGFPVDGGRPDRGTEVYAEVVFCSAQRQDGDLTVNDYAVVRDTIRNGPWSLVLLDVQFDSGRQGESGRPIGRPGDEVFGLSIRQLLGSEFPKLPVVMLTGKRQAEVNDQATPYLSKQSLTSYEFRRALLRFGALDLAQFRNVLDLEDAVVAEDPATLDAFRQVFEHARSDVSLLVLGESGVGKEVLARYAHQVSDRRIGPFVAVNVAAIPRDLVESELFGIGSRVATMVERRPGKFELASGGTLFLDEIGDMPLETQSKVLRALQERVLVRVGEDKELPFDVRIVCATSKDLGELVERGGFRSDLYFRINTVPVTIPPLRSRRQDIAPMARTFLSKFGAQHGKADLSLSKDAIGLLEEQAFTGNVRELQNLMERLASSAVSHQVIGMRDVAGARVAFPAVPDSEVDVALRSQAPGGADEARSSLVSPDLLKPFSTDDATGIARASCQPPGESSDLTLERALSMLERVVIDKDDALINGVKPRVDAAVNALMRRLAGAALERCRDPVDRTLNRQLAMRLLSGNGQIRGKAPARLMNELLRRPVEQPVTEDDMEKLVAEWLQGARR